MAAHTQKGSVSVDAVQWNPPTTTIASIQTNNAWTKRLDLQTPDGSMLHVRTSYQGVLAVQPNDWFYLMPDNKTVAVMANTVFTQLYS